MNAFYYCAKIGNAFWQGAMTANLFIKFVQLRLHNIHGFALWITAATGRTAIHWEWRASNWMRCGWVPTVSTPSFLALADWASNKYMGIKCADRDKHNKSRLLASWCMMFEKPKLREQTWSARIVTAIVLLLPCLCPRSFAEYLFLQKEKHVILSWNRGNELHVRPRTRR